MSAACRDEQKCGPYLTCVTRGDKHNRHSVMMDRERDPDRCNPLKYSLYYLYLFQRSKDRNLPAAFIYTHRIFLKLNSYHFSLHVANRMIFAIDEKCGFL